MGGGLNHLSLLLEFTLINQKNRNTLSLAHGVWTTDVKSTIQYADKSAIVIKPDSHCVVTTAS